ncbi:MAG: amiloride-sensitive sodium channel family protein [Gammaproteobacteria bacterium]|nr:amiloride-sensitive sodium channel family protein [Gammaproteobacteria bacterium]
MGNCFTYNFNTSSARMTYRAGANHGLTVHLQSSQYEYIGTSQTAGYKILIHDATEHPFADNQGYAIAPGTSTDISISKVRRIKQRWG